LIGLLGINLFIITDKNISKKEKKRKDSYKEAKKAKK